MEYEIEDESALFDDSTNPSLERHPEAPAKKTTANPQKPVLASWKTQKAEHIPEEEPEHQLA